MPYEHTQTSPLWLVVMIALDLLLVVTILAVGSVAAVVVSAVVVALVSAVVLALSALTVRVDAEGVTGRFRFGWPAKRVPFSDIVSAAIVRNRWWYGLGIRKIPGGWLRNVWGLDAVELTLRTGRKLRIGTDDPQGLRAALAERVPVG